MIEAELNQFEVFAPDNEQSRELYDQSRFGEPRQGKFVYDLTEALYLLEKQKMIVKSGKKILDYEMLLAKGKKHNASFLTKYLVFKDMRSRGYIVKTALKFGAEFRVYDRGVKPGDDHAKWILYPVHESQALTWYDFAAKNRVAHSTRKRLLVACVDEESDVTYWELSWIRP